MPLNDQVMAVSMLKGVRDQVHSPGIPSGTLNNHSTTTVMAMQQAAISNPLANVNRELVGVGEIAPPSSCCLGTLREDGSTFTPQVLPRSPQPAVPGP